MVSVVIVKNNDRIAIRIVPASVAPIERTADDDQCQQRCERTAHGSSLTGAEPHGWTVVTETRPCQTTDRIPCTLNERTRSSSSVIIARSNQAEWSCRAVFA